MTHHGCSARELSLRIGFHLFLGRDNHITIDNNWLCHVRSSEFTVSGEVAIVNASFAARSDLSDSTFVRDDILLFFFNVNFLNLVLWPSLCLSLAEDGIAHFRRNDAFM